MVNWVLCLVLLSVFAGNSVQYLSNTYLYDGCPAGPVITSTICGQLGNNVWDVASILALARIIPGNRQPYMREYHSHRLRKYFVDPLLPFVEDIPLNCSCWYDSDLYKPNEGKHLTFHTLLRLRHYNTPGNVVLHSPAVAVEAVLHEMEYLRRRLRYKQELIDYANQDFFDITLKFLKQENLNDKPLTFVGVHVRRSDYLQYLAEERRAGAQFFNFAFDYFRKRHDLGKCIFLVVSDDRKWVKKNLISNTTNTDVFLVGDGAERTIGKDIALLSLCNHSIFDYGSFGLWGAVYAGGEVVTTTSYGQDHHFVIYKNFHFFDAVPDKEVFTLSGFNKEL